MHSRLFASGFRPTFLAAGIAALALVPIWVSIWAFGLALPSSWPPTLWHAHEMVFGFIAAAMAGFLLTAVPSWTGRRGFGGAPLAALIVLWLLGRVLIATSRAWPALLVMAVDVGFLILLAALLAPPLLRSGNRNTPLLAVLALLASCNAVCHWALSRSDPATALRAVVIAIDIALLLVTVIGGRIVPAFTASALRAGGNPAQLYSWPGITAVAVAAMIAVAVTDLLWPETPAAGVVAGLAAVIQAARLLQWRSLATWRSPILWVLHLGYVWLPIGLALKAVALLFGSAASAFWLHGLTVGVLATMVLGVMTRVALGHTGRPLKVAPSIVLAYLLLLAAALVRVFGLSVLRLPYATVIVLSATYWSLAFALFLYVYAPILCSARVDGKPG